MQFGVKNPITILVLLSFDILKLQSLCESIEISVYFILLWITKKIKYIIRLNYRLFACVYMGQESGNVHKDHRWSG